MIKYCGLCVHQYHQGFLETDDTFGTGLIIKRREWWGRGGGGEVRWELRQIFLPHPPSLWGKHWHVLDFKCKSVNFDNLFRNKIFGLQIFVPIESFPMSLV